ncbi:putative GTP-binding protein 6 isoform X3 [Pezoporus wallicus]|uniref:putative GTP-binding protein 6 isoform X3 n=1 Tax=Pezoporus wallicus TaxID=35540 RepID=UPI00254CB765|nr:putative GTP-binding protein 6 isoform X3 [Pezoporus wallicus]
MAGCYPPARSAPPLACGLPSGRRAGVNHHGRAAEGGGTERRAPAGMKKKKKKRRMRMRRSWRSCWAPLLWPWSPACSAWSWCTRRSSGAQRNRRSPLVAEAVALVDTLQNWTVLDKIVIPTKNPDKKLIFGKGNFQVLTELEDAWGVKVFDRYTVVLHIFRCNARTKEAKLQIALAEIPLLRSNLKNEVSQLDQQRGGSRYIMGSGETFMEIQYRILKEKELKIRNALEKLRRKRSLLRTQRKKREFPIISVMGYTNCGKTTLIKALTGEAGIQPRDQLFATLDITAHAGYLPSHMAVIYVDTIGFLTDLPHNLVESFSATLEEVVYSDLIVHVRDITHPETILQKATVLSVLKNLNLPSHLLDSMVEVHNKVDLIERYKPAEENVLAISALHGQGLEELKEEIEKKILTATGKKILTVNVDLEGPQLSWLYKEATVQEVEVMPEDGTARVKVIIGNSAFGKYKNLFPNSKIYMP